MLLIAVVSAGLALGTSPASADLISRWTFDGDLADEAPAGNDGVFRGGEVPTFAPGREGEPGGAVVLDGIDDAIELPQGSGLPISANHRYSIALWVRGEPGGGALLLGETISSGDDVSFLLRADPASPSGTVEVVIRGGGPGKPLLEARSSAAVLDGDWHHVAWVDEGGDGALYVDGIAQPGDFRHADIKLERIPDRTLLGALPGDPDCCFLEAALDDVRFYDHALGEAEVRDLVMRSDCPDVGDTHCGEISVSGPPGADGAPGTYVVTVTGASDDSGDGIEFLFEARSDAGVTLRSGPQGDNIALFDLDVGSWTFSTTVDDDLFCPDEAPDARCVVEEPLIIGCPAEGDTHCGELSVSGPAGGGPGTYFVDVIGAFDESGDDVLYTFVAESDTGRRFRKGPQLESSTQISLGNGVWSFEVTADDDPECPDEAGDAVCTTQVRVGCPPEGDTHCDGLIVEPPGAPVTGLYTIFVAARDESGDSITSSFELEREEGGELRLGPFPVVSATVPLREGTWTVRASVDDDPLCPDLADDAVCTGEQLVVEPAPPELISHWPLDGDLFDLEASGNDGVFIGDQAPIFGEGFDGQADGALVLESEEGCVSVTINEGLPAAVHPGTTVALWVKGAPGGGRVWAELDSRGEAVFEIGSEREGRSGRVEVLLRDQFGRTLIARRISERVAFDDTWHHIAWVDDDGQAALWIDGVRDAVDLSYRRPTVFPDSVSIGCAASAGGFPDDVFRGSIDDVRVYSYALSEEEILALVPEPPGCPAEGDTRCETVAVELAPELGAGAYRVSAGAVDDSGDPILYTFTAEHEDGDLLQAGPSPESVAEFRLFAGVWTISAVVDDDLACRDRDPGALCRSTVTVTPPAGSLVSRWPLDGDLVDVGSGGNDLTFLGDDAASFVADRNDTADGALRLDGRDDRALVRNGAGLPLFSHREFSIALWVRGEPQIDRRVFTESSSADERPLFSLGTEFRGVDGRVGIVVRDERGDHVLPAAVSSGVVFDGAWHHLAWVDSDGEAVLYIDGERDPADFTYDRPSAAFDTETIGGLARDPACCAFEGSVDDVRLYDFALSDEEVAELAGGGASVPFHRGDPNDDGLANITDAIFLLTFLFTGGRTPGCMESADVNDDGAVNITDPIALLSFLFLGAAEPDPPGPVAKPCGEDPAGSPSLGCASYASCE